MKTAVLLVNLGTPDEPTTPAVRRYLKEFLSDPRVVEIPRAVWWFILNLLILPVRSGKSAEKYRLVWMKEGSPLKVWTARQALLLRGLTGMRGRAYVVDYAMRYGNPAIPDVLDRLRADGCERILVLPLYPQYSGTTTASTIDAINAWTANVRNAPELRIVRQYHDDDAYIAALASRIVAAREREGIAADPAVKLVMSFHGIPLRAVKNGDPYQTQCLVTAERLAAKLGLSAGQWVATFQSRFGRAEWLRPYTVEVLEELGRTKAGKVAICCPGFPADCLETLEEIAMEGRKSYLDAGGESYHYLPCLDDDPKWIEALATIAERHMGGWLDEVSKA
jgi:ferrochelatase